MGRPRRIFCRRCHRHLSECGPLSARGRCADCGEGEMILNARELAAHSGPRFQRWRRGVAKGVGGVLMDDARAGE